MSQNIVAIDLGVAAARVVLLEVSMRRAVVRSVQTVPFAGDLPADDVWAFVAQRLTLPPHALVLGLDARTTSTRQLAFPFADVRRIEAAVAFELEGQIPYAIDDVAISWQVCERHAQKTQLLTAVTPKTALRQQLRRQVEARLEPRVLMLPAAALAEYVSPNDDAPVALVAIGASQTHIAVCRRGLRFARTLRLGGGDIDRALAKWLNTDPAAGREYRESRAALVMPAARQRGHAEGTDVELDQQRASDVIMAALSPLVMGLVATFKALAPEDGPSRLVLAGGTSRLPGLAAYLAHRLGIPVELLDMQAALPHVPLPAETGPEHAVALGMATSLYRHGRDTPLNFRRNEFAYHGDLQLYRGQLTHAFVRVSLVLCLAIFASAVRYALLRGEERRLDAGFCQATKRIVGRELCDPTAAVAVLKQSSGDGTTFIPAYSATQVLEMLSAELGRELDVQFDELDLAISGVPGQPDRVTGRGEAQSFEATEQLLSQLKRQPCVQEAEVLKQRKGQSAGRVEFNIVVKVACPPGQLPQKHGAGGSHTAT